MLISHVRKEVSHSDWLFVCKLKTNPICIVLDHRGVNFLTILEGGIGIFGFAVLAIF